MAFEILRLLSERSRKREELRQAVQLSEAGFIRLLRTIRNVMAPIRYDRASKLYSIPEDWKIDRDWLLKEGPFLSRNDNVEGKDEVSGE